MNKLNILETQYKQTGKSRETDENGMLEMQSRAFKERQSQYLLIKSPPASGKSRALMFLGLDKLRNQGVKKVIVAVPEMSIGSSFKTTKLTEHGFFEDWIVEPKYNLCVAGGDAGKVDAFIRFLSDADSEILVCTHATLRFAYQRLKPSNFDNTLLGIDEFHHSSASDDNKLGEAIDAIIEGSSAHIVAMTGSYFRGDAVPVMAPEYERLFKQVTYSYYEQLNGYKYLKSLGMNYHFYQNGYLTAISQVLDTTKKTIIHIPSVNSFESTKDKYLEFDAILSVIGDSQDRDSDTGLHIVKTKDGRLLKVADLVTDDKTRVITQNYLSNLTSADDLDIIIALGMAKEGFDWVWCEHVLTVGYRSSLTEIIQIIGRATRDCEGKSHAQFTNLISQPDAENEDVDKSVNNLLKAITVSLLMKQVLTPSINFRPRSRMTEEELLDGNNLAIDDRTAPLSDKHSNALRNIDNIKAALLQKGKEFIAPVMTGQQDVKTFIDYEVARLVSEMHPDLDTDEAEQVARKVHESFVIQENGGVVDGADLPENAEFWDTSELDVVNEPTSQPTPSIVFSGNGDKTDQPTANNPKLDRNGNPINKANSKFVMIDHKFIDVEKLNLNLVRESIENTNPFEGSYSVLSQAITSDALKVIEDRVSASRSNMTEDEAMALFPRVREFVTEYGRPPQLSHSDHLENRLALALALVKERLRRRKTQQQSEKDA